MIPAADDCSERGKRVLPLAILSVFAGVARNCDREFVLRDSVPLSLGTPYRSTNGASIT
jgi:hypothetical protein